MSAILSLILSNGVVQALIAGAVGLLAILGWGAAKKREGRQQGRSEAAEKAAKDYQDTRRKMDEADKPSDADDARRWLRDRNKSDGGV